MAAFRHRVHEILDQTLEGDRTARVVGAGLIMLIASNVAAAILESEPWLDQKYLVWFDVFEMVSILLFTLEYVLRVWSAVENSHGRYRRPIIGRLHYALTPLARFGIAI